MFSSSLLTAETPLPSQAKTGSAKASPDQLAEGSHVDTEEAGAFAKEFQAVVSDEQKINTNQPVTLEPQLESDNLGQLEAGTEAQGQRAVSERVSSEGQAAEIAVSKGEELSNSLIKNTESDVEISAKQTASQQSAQISDSQKVDGNPELDSVKKQQIMSDGEELLSRLSASNKQLAADVGNVPEGKELPPEHTVSAKATAAVKPEQTELQAGQLQTKQPTQQLQAQQVPAEQMPADMMASSHQLLFADESVDAGVDGSVEGSLDGKVAAGDAGSQGSNFPNLTQAELEQGILPATDIAQQSSPGQVIVTDDTATAEAQHAAISQEELAKVFAAPQAQQMSADAELANNQEGSEPDAAVMAMALASGGTASTASAEVKGTGPNHTQSDDLLQQPASPRMVEMTKEQLDGKGKAGSMLTPTAVVTATTAGGASNSNSQPFITDANQVLATSVGNPALSSAAPAVASGILAPNAGTVEAQLAGSAGIAAGTAGMMTALKHGTTDSSTEAKSAELSHSLSGLTTQQGLAATAQARTEAALAQSPLQLSKEQAGDQIAERMQMMMSKNLKHVDIRLDPPELGKLQIKLSLNQDQASVQFTVGNQQTRDLVEQAMPRLRELLSQQGLQLAQSSVQQDSSRQQFAGQSNQQHQGQQAGGGSQQNSGTTHGQEAGPVSPEPVEMYVSQATDRVDYYA